MENPNQVQVMTAENVQLLTKQADAQFAMTPVGQTLKQFEVIQRMGQMFSQSTIVPETYRSIVPARKDNYGNVVEWKENPSALSNCAIAIDMAMRMNLPPVMVMQNLYVVHGMPAWSTKFLIGCINGCGRFTPIEYETKDNVAQDSDDYGVRCVAYAKDDTQRQNPLYGPWITWKMVKAEGWNSKRGSKWLTMPGLMFCYRAAAFWQRLYAPELSMGIMTQEEAYDIQEAQVVEDVKTVSNDVVVPEQLLQSALRKLERCKTAQEVKALRDAQNLCYTNSELFRNALLDKYQSLQDTEEQPKLDTAETATAAPEQAPEQSNVAAEQGGLFNNDNEAF